MSRLAAAGASLVLVAAAGYLLLAPGADAGTGPGARGHPSLVLRGRRLYATGCSSCHGMDAGGIRGTAPGLRGVGALAADFELSTGRMPLAEPSAQPARHTPAYDPGDVRALVAYIASFGGPGIPRLPMARASVGTGMLAFTQDCAGCHQVLGRGGIVTGAQVPVLLQATPTQVAEAVRLGPYLMPRFGAGEIGSARLADIAAYVQSLRRPDDAGGWDLSHVGPIPEGMVAWLIGLLALLGVARLIGERSA